MSQTKANRDKRCAFRFFPLVVVNWNSKSWMINNERVDAIVTRMKIMHYDARDPRSYSKEHTSITVKPQVEAQPHYATVERKGCSFIQASAFIWAMSPYSTREFYEKKETFLVNVD